MSDHRKGTEIANQTPLLSLIVSSASDSESNALLVEENLFKQFVAFEDLHNLSFHLSS